jgi:hypothetical protein
LFLSLPAKEIGYSQSEGGFYLKVLLQVQVKADVVRLVRCRNMYFVFASGSDIVFDSL